jgi:zinc-ribbon domain
MSMKPITGQYECAHRSGVGLDYFTSRLDRLTLQANGRFTLTVQDRSRISNAAQSLISGQQVTAAAPETKREGSYRYQGTSVTLHFDDGTQEQGQLSYNGDGIQIGQNFFNKVSDSTLLPPTHRLKKDMDDIAKGLKIAGTIGGMAVKAAKTIHDTIQDVQSQPGQNQPAGTAQTQGAGPSQGNRVQPTPPPHTPAQPAPQTSMPPQPTQNPPPQGGETLFCDQCGAPVRPGKRFCNRCGARLV